MTYIISLGGSLIYPNRLDLQFVRKFGKLILGYAKRGRRFFIVTGGGKLARQCQALAQATGKISNPDLDWLGIAATRASAEVLRDLFGKFAYPEVLNDPTKKLERPKRINVFSGWKPGRSTDYAAVRLAQTYGIKTVLNLSNIDYVYNADPKEYKNAQPIKQITWQNFRKLFQEKWRPGANLPFDPKASALAEQQGIKVVVMNGRDFKNFQAFLQGRSFKGTVIS